MRKKIYSMLFSIFSISILLSGCSAFTEHNTGTSSQSGGIAPPADQSKGSLSAQSPRVSSGYSQEEQAALLEALGPAPDSMMVCPTCQGGTRLQICSNCNGSGYYVIGTNTYHCTFCSILHPGYLMCSQCADMGEVADTNFSDRYLEWKEQYNEIVGVSEAPNVSAPAPYGADNTYSQPPSDYGAQSSTVCPNCNQGRKMCTSCHGTGQMEQTSTAPTYGMGGDDSIITSISCAACTGTGQTMCFYCSGSGYIN